MRMGLRQPYSSLHSRIVIATPAPPITEEGKLRTPAHWGHARATNPSAAATVIRTAEHTPKAGLLDSGDTRRAKTARAKSTATQATSKSDLMPYGAG